MAVKKSKDGLPERLAIPEKWRRKKINKARVAMLSLPQKWNNPMAKRVGARAQRIRAQSKLTIGTEGTGNNCTKQYNVETEITPILLASENDEEHELEDQSEVLKDRMLGADVVNVPQNHLKAQFDNISGFEDTTLGPHLAFIPAKQDSFIQILHDGDMHWVCVSNIGCTGGTVCLFV